MENVEVDKQTREDGTVSSVTINVPSLEVVTSFPVFGEAPLVDSPGPQGQAS